MKELKQQYSDHTDTFCIEYIFTHFYMLPKHKQNKKYKLRFYKTPKYTDYIYK